MCVHVCVCMCMSLQGCLCALSDHDLYSCIWLQDEVRHTSCIKIDVITMLSAE